MSRFDAASGTPSPGQRYRIASPSTRSSAAGMSRYSSRSPARRDAGSKATSIWPKGSANVPPRSATSDPSSDAKPAVNAQLYRSAAIRTRGSNRPGAVPAPSGKQESIGIDDGGHLMIASLGGQPMQEGQLGQGEQEVRVAA